MVDSGSPSLPPTSNSEAILKDPLYSIYTGAEFKNIPKLKDHLESEWEKLAKKEKKKAAAEVAKRKSEESGDGGEAKRAKTGEEEQ
ncbi:hypothetical protein MNV49_000022 [Pseudohyphozyma bogoriensis]|nr:hypothetical protein MNV49_000022 [Pseudohyphozyma bogoriensis]